MGGSGNDIFNLFSGQAGGTDTITDFTVGKDALDFLDYSSSSVQTSPADQVNAGGDTTIILAGPSHPDASSVNIG